MNAKEAMTRMASFGNKTLHIWIENIREGISSCTKIPTILVQSWALHHSKHVIYLQKPNEINEIQVPSF